MDDERAANLRSWESRVSIHAASRDYAIDKLADGSKRLSDVVAFDAPYLGDLSGVDVLHLQCHIGTDTLSLARLGGQATGLDFSPAALEVAADLARRAGVDIRYVQSELYEAPTALGATYDLVYTGVGALCWLPDITRWAEVVAALLRPGGRLYIREGHPVLWALDEEAADEQLVIKYPYFETESIRFESEFTYTEGPPVPEPVTYEWNHGLGEIVQAVIDAGLTVTGLREHQECEWQALPWMVEASDGKFRLPDGAERLPLMYTLEAVRAWPREPTPEPETSQ